MNKLIMNPISPKKIIKYVELNIPEFHQNRIKKLKNLKLKEILKRKNPYLLK